MSVYNVENYVGEAIESVLNQTCPDFELLLSDDVSAENSGNICEEYRKKAINWHMLRWRTIISYGQFIK